MSTDRLSAVVAVKNEAHQIRECLEGLKFADEVILVDMGSTDRTLEEARGLAHLVLVRDGGPHHLIHANKNAGFEAATGTTPTPPAPAWGTCWTT